MDFMWMCRVDITKWKKRVGLVEGLKTIYNEADRQGAFDSVKEKLLSKARIKKESGSTESNAFGPEAATDKKNVNISAGGFKPDFTDISNYNPNVNIAANLGGNEGFYADAGAGASLQGGVNYNAEAGYKEKILMPKLIQKVFRLVQVLVEIIIMWMLILHKDLMEIKCEYRR